MLAPLAASLLVPARAPGQTPMERILEAQFRAHLKTIADSVHGIVGFASIDLRTGRVVGVNDSLSFPQGSAIKIPLLIELYRQLDVGHVRRDERIPIRKSDQVAGSGVVQWFSDGGTTMSPHDLAVLMISLSDNTTTNILIDRVGGFPAVNRTMDSLGASAIRLRRRMIQPLESARGNENVATPLAAARLMTRVHSCDLPFSRPACAEFRRILELPRSGSIPESVSGGVRVAWKSGSVEGVQTAWGLVDLPGRPYVLAMMVTYGDDGEAATALRSLAGASWEYYRRLARSSAFGVRVPLSAADSIRKP
ncbi:MAG: serine hydrolase [Gemmatimonadota bacterium]